MAEIEPEARGLNEKYVVRRYLAGSMSGLPQRDSAIPTSEQFDPVYVDTTIRRWQPFNLAYERQLWRG